MKLQRGTLPEDEELEMTICESGVTLPHTHQSSQRTVWRMIGSVEVGKMADLVLWKPVSAETEMIIARQSTAYAINGRPNASIPTPQPVIMRPMFAQSPGRSNSVALCLASGRSRRHWCRYGLTKAVEGARTVEIRPKRI
jgi:urease alpha subunit